MSQRAYRICDMIWESLLSDPDYLTGLTGGSQSHDEPDASVLKYRSGHEMSCAGTQTLGRSGSRYEERGTLGLLKRDWRTDVEFNLVCQ
jgi:hypothetical protein